MPLIARITTLILLGCVLAFSLVFFNSRDDTARFQTTDDAYICADSTRVSPQISGRVTAVMVGENQPVRAGDLLVSIDDSEYSLQVRQAEAILEGARASRAGLAEKLEQQNDIIAQAKAVVDADKAALELSRQEYTRYRNLASDGSGSRQDLQQATSAYKVAQANLERDNARYQSETRQLNILRAELDRATALVEQTGAALETARLNLSYCRVVAPMDGIVSQSTVRLGAYVRTGESLLAVVPMHDMYIDAYFRENQLANIRVGQTVSIEVDAFPGKQFSGTVASLGPASNASFSPVAPHSTSSNFTKVVQRLPVRIAITDDGKDALKVGMSVVPTVDTAS